jgi:hypothetical protein
VHRRRLREIWRSAGWPCHDTIEIDLLAAGLIERVGDAQGRDTLRVSEAGVQALSRTRAAHQRARSPHEALVARVAEEMARRGRIAWCGLGLRAKVVRDGAAPEPVADSPALFAHEAQRPGHTQAAGGGTHDPTGASAAPGAAEPAATWGIALPDVYSVRLTTVAAYLQPMVHEIKVRRADLLADLRQAAKRAAYLQMAGQCWYVLAEGIGEADEIPPECGVMVARGEAAQARLEVLRHAPQRAMAHEAGLPFAVWMALARATPFAAPEDTQGWLGDPAAA